MSRDDEDCPGPYLDSVSIVIFTGYRVVGTSGFLEHPSPTLSETKSVHRVRTSHRTLLHEGKRLYCTTLFCFFCFVDDENLIKKFNLIPSEEFVSGPRRWMENT